jgi:hypothetical protein
MKPTHLKISDFMKLGLTNISHRSIRMQCEKYQKTKMVDLIPGEKIKAFGGGESKFWCIPISYVEKLKNSKK